MRRTQLGLSQEAVAASSEDGISQKAVSDLETGRVHLTDMSMGRVVALARALSWSLEDLQRATGVDLGIVTLLPLGHGEPTPVYSLPSLGLESPQPDGMNVTPNPGPHPANWMQTFMDSEDMDPRIRRGESIYFDTDKVKPDKGVYVVRYDGRGLVRRFSQLPTGPAWTADNPAFAHQFIPDSPAVIVLGKIYRVVGIRDGKALN